MKNRNKKYVIFKLSVHEVENPNEIVAGDEYRFGEEKEFSFAHFVNTTPSKGAMGSATYCSIDINESRVIEEGSKEGFSIDLMYKATFVHEIGHNLGLEENQGGITIIPTVLEKDPQFGYRTRMPNVTASGVRAIMSGLNKRTHKQCLENGVGTVKTKQR